MAECTISRCSQERRVFRKEFQRWSRNILFVVGFERIAEEIMGRHRWENFSTPFTDLENTEPIDWSPDDICYFCDSKKNPPYDPASGLQAGEDYLSCRIDADDQSVSSDQGIGAATVRWRKGGSSSPAGSTDQPLDLSLTSGRKEGDPLRPGSRGSVDSESDSTGSFLKVPHISMKPGQKRRFDPNGKRSYTEEELQAALRDIQSGKLGTRRAAVIYGIPRSTLRNKVYKMSNARGRRRCIKQPAKDDATKADGDTSKSSLAPPKKVKEEVKRFPAEGGKNGVNSSASESLRQLLKHTIIQKKSSAGEDASKKTEGEEEEIEEVKGSAAEDRKKEEEQLGYQWLGSQEYGHTLAPFLAQQMLSNIQHLALSRGELPRSSKDDLKLPILPELIRRLAEERLESACSSERRLLSASSAHRPSITPCASAEADLANVILKIPSFKPTKVSEPENNNNNHQQASSTQSSSSQNSGNNSRGITVSLKELIARSINQRMGTGQSTVVSAAEPELADLGKQYVAANDLAEVETKTIQESTRACVLQTTLSNAEKRCRPKRGRYRNYDTDNLAQAVRSVQKGEMSVHRAGTHYGVPHSTLEYKVKERHLLRPKKRDGSISSLLQQSSGLPKRLEGSKILNGENAEQSVQPQRLPVVPSVLWQGLPFFPVELAGSGSEHFFASQMMKRLQESVRQQQQQHQQQHQHQQEVHGHLLEGLIKATLEKAAVVGNMPGTTKKGL